MEISIESGIASRELRLVAERRARFVFRRLHWLVQRAHIRLADVNGPRGGLDKQCSVSIDVPGGPPLVVRSLAHDWRVALDGALHRAARGLLRVWRRRHARPRGHEPHARH